MKNQMIKVNAFQTVSNIISKLESLGYARDVNDLELNLNFVPECICTYELKKTYTLHRHLAVGFGGRSLVDLIDAK